MSSDLFILCVWCMIHFQEYSYMVCVFLDWLYGFGPLWIDE